MVGVDDWGAGLGLCGDGRGFYADAAVGERESGAECGLCDGGEGDLFRSGADDYHAALRRVS